MERYFKKPNGVIVQMHKYHNEEDLKARFIECDAKGNLVPSSTTNCLRVR